jgi:hypothetical protein
LAIYRNHCPIDASRFRIDARVDSLIDWPTICSSLQQVIATIADLPVSQVTWRDQKQPYNPNALVKLHNTAERRLGFDYETYDGDDLVVLGHRAWTLNIQVEAVSQEFDAWAPHYVSKIRTRLGRTSTREQLRKAGISIIQDFPSVEIPLSDDNRVWSRYQDSYELNATIRDKDDSVWDGIPANNCIETVRVVGEIDGQERIDETYSLVDLIPLDNIELLFEAGDEYVETSGALVTKWIGQTEIDAESQPTKEPNYIASYPGLNGEPVLWFTASQRMNLTGWTSESNSFHVVSVLDVDSIATASYLLRQDLPLIVLASNSTLTADVGGHDGSSWLDVDAATTGPQLLEWIWDPTPNPPTFPFGCLAVLRNGVELGRHPFDGEVSISLTTAIMVGAFLKVAFLGVWSDVLPESDVTRLRNGLIDRYLS